MARTERATTTTLIFQHKESGEPLYVTLAELQANILRLLRSIRGSQWMTMANSGDISEFIKLYCLNNEDSWRNIPVRIQSGEVPFESGQLTPIFPRDIWVGKLLQLRWVIEHGEVTLYWKRHGQERQSHTQQELPTLAAVR